MQTDASFDTTENRIRILHAAADLFVINGFTATSMLDFSTRARLGMQAIHAVFTTKEEIFSAIVKDNAARFFSRLERIIAQPQQDPLKILEAYCGAMMDAYWEDRRFFLLLVNEKKGAASLEETLDATKEPADRRQVIQNRLKSVFVAAMAKGCVRPINASLHCALLEGLIRSYVLYLSQTEGAQRERNEEKEIWESYLRGIAPSPSR